MTAAERSFIGLARQSAKDSINVTDADFKYVLFRTGGIAPQNVVIPLDPEVGGGAMLRNMHKVGVTSGGALDIIPRPSSLGWFLYGALGEVEIADLVGGTSLKASADSVMPRTELMPSLMLNWDLDLTNPPSPVVLVVKGFRSGAVALTGNVVVTGTGADDKALEETFILADNAYVPGVLPFKTVTQVDLPVRINAQDDAICIGWDDPAYSHEFHLPADQFDAPYWTIRSAPGNLLGEQFANCRVAGLSLTFAGARFIEGAVTFVGGLPLVVDTATWGALAKVDGGPQFLSPVSSIKFPDPDAIKVLSGSVAWGLAIPLDEQWIVGSYSPDDFAINQRSMVITLNVKIDDEVLYTKMMYDPAGAGIWAAELFEEAAIELLFNSPSLAAEAPPVPFSINIDAQTAADNIVWSAAPIGLRAGRQVVMAVTGVVKATSAGEPITVTLINTDPSVAPIT